MEKLIGKNIKVSDKIKSTVNFEYGRKFNYMLIINQYIDSDDLLVGFFEDYIDLDMYKDKLIIHGFDSNNDMYIYNFKTYFIKKEDCNYKQITRLAKIKELLKK